MDSGSDERFRLPAEFEPQRALWLAWPRYENRRGHPTDPLTLRILEAARGRVQTELLVEDAAEAERLSARAPEARVHRIPHGDVWMRDFGPTFLVGDRGGLRIAEFRFSRWGYESPDSPASRLDGAIARRAAERLGIPLVRSPLVSEGGARESNGAGVLMLVEAVERQRNPDWTLAAIEAEYRRVLGATRIVWLAAGVPEDDHATLGPLPGGAFTAIGTGGHADEFARFADPRTVLLAEVAPGEPGDLAAIARERLEENLVRLRAARDAGGRPFRILRAPVPDPILAEVGPGDGVYEALRRVRFRDGSRIAGPVPVVAAASYLNFQITNGLVLAPRYWKPGLPHAVREKDEAAEAVLRAAFPVREVVGFDPLAANFGGGGIHCMIQQEPVAAPLY